MKIPKLSNYKASGSCTSFLFGLFNSEPSTFPPLTCKTGHLPLDIFSQLSLSPIKGRFSRCQGESGWEAEGTEMTIQEDWWRTNAAQIRVHWGCRKASPQWFGWWWVTVRASERLSKDKLSHILPERVRTVNQNIVSTSVGGRINCHSKHNSPFKGREKQSWFFRKKR